MTPFLSPSTSAGKMLLPDGVSQTFTPTGLRCLLVLSLSTCCCFPLPTGIGHESAISLMGSRQCPHSTATIQFLLDKQNRSYCPMCTLNAPSLFSCMNSLKCPGGILGVVWWKQSSLFGRRIDLRLTRYNVAGTGRKYFFLIF